MKSEERVVWELGTNFCAVIYAITVSITPNTVNSFLRMSVKLLSSDAGFYG